MDKRNEVACYDYKIFYINQNTSSILMLLFMYLMTFNVTVNIHISQLFEIHFSEIVSGESSCDYTYVFCKFVWIAA